MKKKVHKLSLSTKKQLETQLTLTETVHQGLFDQLKEGDLQVTFL